MEKPSWSTRVWNTILRCSLKKDRIISVRFQGKPFNIRVIQVYAPTTNAKKAEQFYDDLQGLLELTPQKDILFIIGHWNAKVGSREISGVTGKFQLGVQNEAGQRLKEFCQENALVIVNIHFQQHKWWLHMGSTKWSVRKSDWLYYLQLKMDEFYTVIKNKIWRWLWLRSWTSYCTFHT